jgi:hypothetical protein
MIELGGLRQPSGPYVLQSNTMTTFSLNPATTTRHQAIANAREHNVSAPGLAPPGRLRWDRGPATIDDRARTSIPDAEPTCSCSRGRNA